MSSFKTIAKEHAWPMNLNGNTDAFYDGWAGTYENDVSDIGYKGPEACLNIVEKWMTPYQAATVMDIACGTGLVGEEFLKRGYTNLTLDGIDFSEESVKMCKTKQIYRRVLCGKVGTDKMNIDKGFYDTVLCVGCFSPGHINQESFPELVRITKPGGVIVITMNAAFLENGEPFDGGRFEEAVKTFSQLGIWGEFVERQYTEGYFGKSKGITFVFKVLKNDF